MAGMNKFCVLGRLTREPELAYTKAKMAYSRITIAVDRKFKAGGEEKKDTFFINATAWGGKAEFINEYATKGMLVYAEGPLSTNRWEDKEGNKREGITMMIDDIQLCEKTKKGE